MDVSTLRKHVDHIAKQTKIDNVRSQARAEAKAAEKRLLRVNDLQGTFDCDYAA